MKLITVEEHYTPSWLVKEPAPPEKAPVVPGTLVDAPLLEDMSRMFDLSEKRLKDMDADGVTMQVVSAAIGQLFPKENAAAQCRMLNTDIANKVKEHPDRFAAFATIPVNAPEACAEELEYAVKELGMVGSIIGGRIGSKFLSEECFDEFLAKSEELGVPIYLHPNEPPKEVTDICYREGLRPEVTASLARYGFGWHVDTGIHMLNMVLTGVFDRYPKLQMILGHWGEFLPYFFDRFDASMPAEFVGLKHNPSYYLRNNMYITPSGIFTPALLEYCISMVGVDRILFSIDYPCCASTGKEKILNHPMLCVEDKEKIFYKNAEKLLKL